MSIWQFLFKKEKKYFSPLQNTFQIVLMDRRHMISINCHSSIRTIAKWRAETCTCNDIVIQSASNYSDASQQKSFAYRFLFLFDFFFSSILPTTMVLSMHFISPYICIYLYLLFSRLALSGIFVFWLHCVWFGIFMRHTMIAYLLYWSFRYDAWSDLS